jgi:hypothetical protein
VKLYNDILLQEEFKDTKGVTRSRKSKNRQHNGQEKKDKQRSTKHTNKIKDRVSRTPLKTGGELKNTMAPVVLLQYIVQDNCGIYQGDQNRD